MGMKRARKNSKGGEKKVAEPAPAENLVVQRPKAKKWKKKNQKGPALPPPNEGVLKKIFMILERFRDSDYEVYTIEENLNNAERGSVHQKCRSMGMTSKSSGAGDQRRITLYKNKKNTPTKEKEVLTCVKFSEESNDVLQDLFMRFPPRESDTSYEKASKIFQGTKKIWKTNDFFSRPSMNKVEIAKKVDGLARRRKGATNTAGESSRLPIASFRDAITETVDSHQVVLISGETGCGKTTQVPQYILDHMWSKGKTCKIVCTQPRRISATSVAERISFEIGESLGETVGYKIRLDSVGGRNSSLVFCTNGILIRVLVSGGTSTSKAAALSKSAKGAVTDITHIIVDEIHERDRYSDLMLAILREMLPSNPHLRLILMSATLDAERFSAYFGGCPVIRVPGFTYPVKTFFLEDVLTILKSEESNHLSSSSSCIPADESELPEDCKIALDEAITLACTVDEFEPLLDLISGVTPKIFNYQHSCTGVTPLMVVSGKGLVGGVCMLLSFGADCFLQAKDGTNALMWAEKGKHRETAELIREHMGNTACPNSKEEQNLVAKYLASTNTRFIDVVLIVQLISKICVDSVDGAILVFLSGWDDITKTHQALLSKAYFSDSSKFLILPLHSMVPALEQRQVFKRPPSGCRKIILSTNIAETAVTIDDVVYVINGGRMKEKDYDPESNISTLESSWISKASAKQREGRAGRCQPGLCYHLYSKLHAASLPDYRVPEIQRMPIEDLCLQVKILDPNCEIEAFLRKLLDPPVSETIRNAVVALQDIGALTSDEKLTELGVKLGSLPVHPSTCKMLFFSILMSCLDPALTLACVSDSKDPFTLPISPEGKVEAAAAKAELASLYGGQSDQLAVIAAFDCWKNAKERGQEKHFCSTNFISSKTMNMLSHMRMQLRNELVEKGFVVDVSSCSLNAKDPGILHAVLVAGLYPMVGRLILDRRRPVIETEHGDKVMLHRQSCNYSKDKQSEHPLVVFDEITRGDFGLNIRKCSLVGPVPLLFLASEIIVAPGSTDEDNIDDESDDGFSNEDDIGEHNGHKKSGDQDKQMIMSSADNTVTVIVDRWLSFETTALVVAQIYCLRERLAAATLFKVNSSHEALPPILGDSIYALACILSYEGQTGVSSKQSTVDSLTSKLGATGINNPAAKRRQLNHNLNEFRATLSQQRSNHDKIALPLKNVFHGTTSCSIQPPALARKRNTEKTHLNGAAKHFVQRPWAAVGPAAQNYLSQSSNLAGYGVATYGPYGPIVYTLKHSR